MKHGNSCSHCSSTDLFSATVYGGGAQGTLLPVGLWHGPRYENIICGSCGYTQWFVSKEHLLLVREKLKPFIAKG